MSANIALLAQPMRGFTSAMSTAPTSSPSSSTVPVVGNMRPEATRRSVVLPAPLGPMTTHRSPSSILRSTSESRNDEPRRTDTRLITTTLDTGPP
jgi:hypothetical protein